MLTKKSIEYHDDSGIVFVKVIGEQSVEMLKEVIIETLAAVEKHSASKILVDDTEVDATIGVLDIYNLPDHFWDNQYCAAIKLALVIGDKSPIAENYKFFENAARNRGIRASVFAGKEDALAWLNA